MLIVYLNWLRFRFLYMHYEQLLFSLSPSNKTRKKKKKKTTTTKSREERIHVSFSIGSKWIDFLDHYFNIDCESWLE